MIYIFYKDKKKNAKKSPYFVKILNQFLITSPGLEILPTPKKKINRNTVEIYDTSCISSLNYVYIFIHPVTVYINGNSLPEINASRCK